jgi:hypothetical protein
MINTSGEWWKGTGYPDVEDYLRELKPGGYAVDDVVQAGCACGGARFALDVDQDNELARTRCCVCGRVAFVVDSEEHWKEAEARPLRCPCGKEEYEVGLGRCIRDGEWVRWMSLGVRCVSCGVLASPLDWKSDLALKDAAARRIG